MNCKCCGRPRTFDQTLCESCLDDCESGLAAINHDESILDRLLREHRIRARMPRFGLKPPIKSGE